MNHGKIKIKEEDMLKLVLEFLNSRNLHVSMRTLEKESGIVNNCYPDDVLFLRELILDGDWDEVLLFAQPFENLDGFNSKQFKYVILKQKFIELLSMKSHIVGKKSTNTIEEVMQTLNQLEETCPSKEEYSNLCWLLTVPNLIERNEFKEWTLDNSRLNCFTSALEIIRNVIPFEKKPKKNTVCASKGRLLQLMVKGLLYETCIDLCQIKATGNDNEIFGDIRVNILQSSGDDYSANLLSWLRSLSSDVFNQPFEQLSLEVILEKVVKYVNHPRHSLDFTKEGKQQMFDSQVARSLDNFDKKSSSSNSKSKNYQDVSHTLATLKHANKHVTNDKVNTAKETKLEKDISVSDSKSMQLSSEVSSKSDIISVTPTMKITPSESNNKKLHKTPLDKASSLINNDSEMPKTTVNQESEGVSSENDVHLEKEKQRASVLQKLKDYENRKKQMHDIISKHQRIESDILKHQNDESANKEPEKTSTHSEMSKSNNVTPKGSAHVVNFPQGAAKIQTSTPKPARKNEIETPPPEASPVSHMSITNDLRRFAANKTTKKSTVSKNNVEKEDVSREKGKENEPKDVENTRKGPMINGVRRALASPPLLSQSSEESNSKTSQQTQVTQINKKRLQFEDEPDSHNALTSQGVEKTKIKHDENVPVIKGPGPKIKTRDGNKVYVTELLKSREEIKNANACSQNQEINEKEEKAEIVKNSCERELNDDETHLSFSPVCMLEDSQAIRAVSFHPDGRLFAVGSNSKLLRICKVDSFDSSHNTEAIPEPSVVFKRNRYHKGSIYCMAWNPLGDVIATGSNDKSIKLMRFDPDHYVQDGVESDLAIHNGTIRELAFMPDKPSVLVSGGAGDGAIQITDCSTCQTLGTLRGHSGNVMSVYAGDGDIIASGSTDNTLRLWDLRSYRCIDVILVGDSSPASVTLNKDGSYLASGQEDGCILLYDISAGRTLQSFRLHQEDCRSVRFSPDSRFLLTGSYDTDISLLHTVGNLELTVPRHYKVASHKDKVIQCRWHPTKYAFLSSSADRTVLLWSSNIDRNQYFL